MKIAEIELSELAPNGNAEGSLRGGAFAMTTTRAIHDVGYNIRRDLITSHMSVPGKFKLPMKIETRAKIDSPEFLLLVGGGHISFASPWMENRRIEDIAEPLGKPRTFDNKMPLGEYADISVTYNLKSMQVLINGEERFFSKKERYMKSPELSRLNGEGINIGVTCTKRAEFEILSITVTEGEDDFFIGRNADLLYDKPALSAENNAAVQLKPTFESCVKDLPGDIKNEIINTEKYLKALKNLKFKRTIEKHGNKITYVESGRGVSYALYLSGNVMHHSFQWYIVTNGKAETWRRKDNPLEYVLNEIKKTDEELAGRVFHNLNECISCRPGCGARTVYRYGNDKKATCHGNVFYKMCAADFSDVRKFFGALNEI